MESFNIKNILKKNKENNFVFDGKKHKYFVNSEEYISATKLISKYFVFDEQKAAKFVAAKYMTTKEVVLEDWKKIRDEGSLIHSLADKFVKNKNLKSYEKDKIKGVVDFFKSENYEVLASELKIFSKKHKVAGTPDLILEKEGKLYIADYKTNKKDIVKDDYFDNALEPFNEFANNKFHIYSMQLSIYAHILKEEYNIEIYDFFVIQLKDNSYKIVPLMNLIYEAEQLLNLASDN